VTHSPHTSALENAVKALDAPPTLAYAQETDKDTDADVSPAIRFRSANRDAVQKACITFSAKGLVRGSGRQSQRYLVLLQNDMEIGRTEAVDESENVTWKPAQVVFSDEWMPVSVQVCVCVDIRVFLYMRARMCTVSFRQTAKLKDR
jgi:hypothetical protein